MSPRTRKSSKRRRPPVSTGVGGTKPTKKVKMHPRIPRLETTHMPILPNGIL